MSRRGPSTSRRGAVDRDQQEEREHDERGQQPERGRQRGQGEDVESDVAGEDRVGDAERRLVDRRSTRSQAGVAAKPASSPTASETGRVSRAERRRDVHVRRRLLELEHDRVGDQAPLRHPQIDVEHAGGEAAHAPERAAPGDELPGEDDLVPDLPEPPPVGEQDVESREQEQHREGGEQHDREAASEHGQSSDAGRTTIRTYTGGREGGRSGGRAVRRSEAVRQSGRVRGGPGRSVKARHPERSEGAIIRRMAPSLSSG